MKKHNKFLVIALLVSLPFAANAYDADQAEHILNTVTGQMNQQFFLTKPCKIEAVEVLKMLEQKKKVTLLDIRTPQERGVVALNHPSALSIPMNELFKKENLDRLPEDNKIIVVCHSGNRASGTTALLKSAGFKDVVYVNGGLISLVTNLTPKTVPVE
ncbi:MAG TPA: rhodanese-like domain-containing protein [Gammaproteobacteria bacterium]